MKRLMSTRAILTVVLALTGAALLAAGQPASERSGEAAPAEASASEDDATRNRAAAPGGAGMRVYLDPETGQLTGPPAAGDEETAPRDPLGRFSTYSGDLIEERLPGRGFKVDLRGRFQSAVVATIDPETQEVTIDCVTAPAAASERDEREAPDAE